MDDIHSGSVSNRLEFRMSSQDSASRYRDDILDYFGVDVAGLLDVILNIIYG